MLPLHHNPTCPETESNCRLPSFSRLCCRNTFKAFVFLVGLRTNAAYMLGLLSLFTPPAAARRNQTSADFRKNSTDELNLKQTINGLIEEQKNEREKHQPRRALRGGCPRSLALLLPLFFSVFLFTVIHERKGWCAGAAQESLVFQPLASPQTHTRRCR